MPLPVAMERPRWFHVLLIVLLFVLTRAWAMLEGFRYLGSESAWLLQLLDLDVLHHHLMRALFHLHAQPPLFNLAVGIALKAGGGPFGKVMLGFQLLLSLGAAVSVYLTLVALRMGSALSLGVSVVLLLNPALLLFEFDALYSVMVYALHCFIALSLVCFVRSRSKGWLGCLLALMVMLTLLRASYQWVWLACVLGILWYYLPTSRGRLLKMGAAGVLLAMVWPAKNLMVFGHFTSSSWAPYSLSRHWLAAASREPMSGWIRDGRLPTFEAPPIEVAPTWVEEHYPAVRTGLPELDETFKSGGSQNWNTLSRLRMFEAQKKDDWFLLVHEPREYIDSVVLAVVLYFRPSTDYLTLGAALPYWTPSVEQYARVAALDGWVKTFCCGLRGAGGANADGSPALAGRRAGRLLSLCFGAIAANGLVLLCVLSFRVRRSLWDGSPERRIVLGVLSFTVLYSFLVASLAEVGENMRFRFETEALVMIVAAVFLRQVWESRSSRGSLRGLQGRKRHTECG